MPSNPYTSHFAVPDGAGSRAGIDTLDLTPEGLADAPAHEEDFDSLVHTGNS
jgi:hypothetical protein